MRVPKVTNLVSPRSGRPVANQFFIDCENLEFFQSYDSIIAVRDYINGMPKITLDRQTWDYSTTTGKYRNIFLEESKKETQAKIDSGEYELDNLNADDKVYYV